MGTNAPKVLLRSEESGGEIAIVELGGGGRPPLHRHDFDETFYILEGELTFQLDDDLFTRRAGELAFAPRGVAHTYANLSGAPARALLVITPAGFERYFDGIAARVSGTEPPAEAAKPCPRWSRSAHLSTGRHEHADRPRSKRKGAAAVSLVRVQNMTQDQDLDAIARSIVDANRFMALGTADASGMPWVSPVWYAPLSPREYVWVSRPGTRHSCNLAERPQVAITIYDSHRPGTWAAVYLVAAAEELEEVEEVEVALEAFNRRSESQGLRAWSRAEVVSPGEFRLYRATASEQFVLGDHDSRLPVRLERSDRQEER